eukprot:TRINITY_DN21499_c0_g1_i2.p1 TRINITY_DN21499_c0_g1~~TRINITY_DN21499_c0_g1_i2.p1  ORF type:complete len:178 (+),score=47.37 TRINITY_DN21499_c0_g1_i2:59-535(+)
MSEDLELVERATSSRDSPVFEVARREATSNPIRVPPVVPDKEDPEHILSSDFPENYLFDRNLAVRNLFDKMETVEQRIKFIKKVKEHADKQTSLHSKSRTWMSRTGNPVVKCLDRHFSNDSKAMASRLKGIVSWSRFSDKHCAGVGDCTILVDDEAHE